MAQVKSEAASFFSFPPFFTKQVNTDVEHKRLSLWQDYLLDSFKGKNTVLADITSCLGKPPFANPSISRSLTLEDIRHILDSMVGAGVCEWTSTDRTRAFIWWKSPDEWANELHKYALRTGEAEVVETVAYFESEAGSPVLGMQEEVILRVCHTLVSKNRAIIMAADSGATGIRFYGQ